MLNLPLHSSKVRHLSTLTLFWSFISVTHALDLEGHTGYMMVPSARTLPANTIVAAWNYHDNQGVYGDPYNLFVGIAPLSWTEIVCRYAFPDLSVNGKIGFPLYETDRIGVYAGYGAQDVWGGAHLFHAQYGVATARFGVLEGSVGWGSGAPLDVYGACQADRCRLGRTGARLEGWFHGAALRMPTPKSWPLSLELVEDYDGNTQRLGSRLAIQSGSWGVQGLLASGTKKSDAIPELQIVASYELPELATPRQPPLWELAPVVLQFGPDLRTFVGTEVGNLDAQIALNNEMYLNLSGNVTAGTRVRTRLWNSENFEDGGPFNSQLQEPRVWWESGSVGWVSDKTESGQLIAQGGWIDGDNYGPALRYKTSEIGGFSGGGTAGWWYSIGWKEIRTSWIGSIEWNSPSQSLYGIIDIGQYWNQDYTCRLHAGRRWGAFTTSLGLFRTLETNESIVEGRLSWNFTTEESELTISNWGLIRPTPEWSHGLRTKVGTPGKEFNSLRVSPGVEPPTLL